MENLPLVRARSCYLGGTKIVSASSLAFWTASYLCMRAVLRLATALPRELLYMVTQGGRCSMYLSSSSGSRSGISSAGATKEPSFLVTVY